MIIRRFYIFEILLTVACVAIYIILSGYLGVKIVAIQNGAILDWSLQLIGVASSRAAGLHYLALVFLSLLLIFPYCVKSLTRIPSWHDAVLSFLLSGILLFVIVWVMSTESMILNNDYLHGSAADLILKQVGFQPLTAVVVGVGVLNGWLVLLRIHRDQKLNGA